MHDVGESPARRRCANCNQIVREGIRFCPNCGQSLENPNSAPPSVVNPPSAFERHWIEIKRILFLFGVLLASSFVVGILPWTRSSPWPETLVAIADAIVIVLFASVAYKDVLPLLRAPRLSWRGAFELAGVVLVTFSIVVAYFALIERAGIPIVRVSRTYEQARWTVGAMFVFISLVPAVCEELAFRGVIQSSLEHVFDKREALIIQAALFSVLHLSPVIFPSHFLMGLCFGYVRRRSGSLYPSMVLHASWNALVLCGELYWS